jgi:hypothetical protein
MHIMAILLLILSSLNLVLALIAYIPIALGPTCKNSKELGSIALSSTKQRKLYALILGLMTCVGLGIAKTDTVQTSQLILGASINIITIALSYLTQLQLQRMLRKSHSIQSIAVIKLEGGTETPVELWLKKSDQEWPPVNLEIGMGPWVVLANCINSNLLEQIRTIFKQSNLIKESALQENLKKILNDHGVTHPMDIDGSNCVPEINEFFERTLIKAQ